MTARRRVVILGSTGTVGRLACDVILHSPERFEVIALGAGRNLELLAEQILRFRPRYAAVLREEDRARLRGLLQGRIEPEIIAGAGGPTTLASVDADLVVNALVGARGLAPSLEAVRRGRLLALANKESLVIGGELLTSVAARSGGRIVPIDSEHSGLMQCLEGRTRGELSRVILTASGGPFRTLPLERLASVTVSEALDHPTWRMGARITIDSATLLNKGFEVHEARWLFDVPPDRIGVWIHPQSVVHALAEWTDGTLIAQMSVADMRIPILAAIGYPDRLAGDWPRCDLAFVGRLEFDEVDARRYPAYEIARRTLSTGGTAPAALNAGDEVLVSAFLEGRIRFTDIPLMLERLMEDCPTEPALDLPTILEADRWARDRVGAMVAGA